MIFESCFLLLQVIFNELLAILIADIYTQDVNVIFPFNLKGTMSAGAHAQ